MKVRAVSAGINVVRVALGGEVFLMMRRRRVAAASSPKVNASRIRRDRKAAVAIRVPRVRKVSHPYATKKT